MVKNQLAARGIDDEDVLAAMSRVPRHLFVPARLRHLAYTDGPLPIGSRQTISQPYIVALMTQLLNLRPGSRVLDVGTGSGYQAAVLAELVDEVVSIERIPALAEKASALLSELGYSNVRVIVGDGSVGYALEAPYDGILVAAAAPAMPRQLLDQLSISSRLVVPVGIDYEQVLYYAIRTGAGSGDFIIDPYTPVRFVPLIGQDGFTQP